MATEVVYWDDLDLAQGIRTPAVRSGYEIEIDGKTCEIDLSQRRLDELTEAIAPFIKAARRAGPSNVVVSMRGRRIGGPANGASKEDKERNDAIRTWAAKHRIKVAPRGRIPAAVIEAWDNRDPVTGAPAANETVPRIDDDGPDEPAQSDTDVTYAASNEDFQARAHAWARNKGLQINPRGFGLTPMQVETFIAETGVHRPLEGSNTKVG